MTYLFDLYVKLHGCEVTCKPLNATGKAEVYRFEPDPMIAPTRRAPPPAAQLATRQWHGQAQRDTTGVSAEHGLAFEWLRRQLFVQVDLPCRGKTRSRQAAPLAQTPASRVPRA